MSPGPQIERRVLRNAGALAVARGTTMVLSLVTFAYLARVLEPERFGVLSIGLALVAYFGLPVNFGLDVLGVRELAREARRSDELVGAILGLRTILVVLALGAYTLVVSFFDMPWLYKLVLWIQGLALIGQAISLEWVYQGLERMGVVAVRNVAVAAMSLAGTLLLVRSPDDVLVAAAVGAASLIAANGSLLLTYARRLGTVRVRLRRSAWLPLLKPALPLWASHAMVIVAVYLDTLLVGLLAGEEAAGLYAAVYKLAAIALVPAEILLLAFLPTLANAFGTLGLMRERARAFATALFSLGLPICLGGALLAPDLTTLVYGPDYASASVALALLMANMLLAYGAIAYGQPLVAWDKERAFLLAFTISVALNIPLDLVLIPRFGIDGAATGTVIAQAISAAILFALHYRLVRRAYVAVAVKVAVASAAGVAAPVLLGQALGWPLPALILAAVVLYALVGYVFRLLDYGLLLGALRGRSSLPSA